MNSTQILVSDTFLGKPRLRQNVWLGLSLQPGPVQRSQNQTGWGKEIWHTTVPVVKEKELAELCLPSPAVPPTRTRPSECLGFCPLRSAIPSLLGKGRWRQSGRKVGVFLSGFQPTLIKLLKAQTKASPPNSSGLTQAIPSSVWPWQKFQAAPGQDSQQAPIPAGRPEYLSLIHIQSFLHHSQPPMAFRFIAVGLTIQTRQL